MDQKKACKMTSIGGSALIEGIMMRGPSKIAMAVRKPNGEIDLSSWEISTAKPWYKTTPFIRGIFNFFDSMIISYKCITKSAEIAGFEDAEPSKFELKLKKLLGDNFTKVLTYFSVILGVGLAVLLFMVLPTTIVGLVKKVVGDKAVLSIIETLVKLLIFILYIWAITLMPDIKRTFEYHGAEHKTIACYEANEELTVENVKKYTRFHPRCGTSFIVIVLIVSAIISSQITWSTILGRIALKLLCLPLVVGISYEIIKLAGRSDNKIVQCISKPGLWTQRLTTKEPDDGEIECAIAAMKPCIPENNEDDKW